MPCDKAGEIHIDYKKSERSDSSSVLVGKQKM